MTNSEMKDYILSSGIFSSWAIQYRFDETKFSDSFVLVIREQPSSPGLNIINKGYDIYFMGRENKPSDRTTLESISWQLRQFIHGYLTDELQYPEFNCIINTEITSEPRLFGETDTNRILYQMSVNILTGTVNTRG